MRERAGRLLPAAVALVILLAPLPFAGRTPGASVALCAAAALTGLVALVASAGRVPIPASAGLLGLVLFACATAVPLPAPLIRLLNPASAALQEQAAALGPRTPADGAATGFLTLSSAPSATLATVGRLGALVALFFAACVLARRPRGARTIAAALVGCGALQSAIGLAAYLEDRNRIFGYTRQAWLGRLTGTYINPNHFAALIEMSAPLALALLLAAGAREASVPARRHGLRRRTAALLSDSRTPRRLLLAGALALMLIALLLTRSRGGIALGAAALVPVVLYSLASRRTAEGHRTGRVLLVTGLALAAMFVLPALWPGVPPQGGAAASRSWQEAPADLFAPGGRVDAWSRALPILRAHPLAGSGPGSFAWEFARVRGPGIRYRDQELHNDWLQALVEGGLVTGVLILLVLAALIRAAVAAFARESGDASARLLRVGAVSAAGALLLHETFDFNLQIPANALLFAALAAVATVLDPSRERTRPRAAEAGAGAGTEGRLAARASFAAGAGGVLLALWGAVHPADAAASHLDTARGELLAADRLLADPLAAATTGRDPIELLGSARRHLEIAERGHPAIADIQLVRARVERLGEAVGEAGASTATLSRRLAFASSLDRWRADLHAGLLEERVALGETEAALEDLRALASRGGGPVARVLPLLLATEPDADLLEEAILDGARDRGEVSEGDGWGDARLLYADALLATGRDERAQAWLERMLRADDAPAHLLAGAYVRHVRLVLSPEDRSRSAALGRSLVERTARAPASERGVIRTGLASALAAAGRSCEAADEAAAALALLPRQPGVRLEAAGHALACGRAAEAAAGYEYLLRGGAEAPFLAENEPVLRAGLARSYESLGRREEALREWRAALKLDPGDSVARDRVLMLESGL